MTDKEQIIIDGVSDFCLVCYYDNKNKELVRIEQYKDGSGDIQTDIESHKYSYNAEIIKPDELIEQLARKTQECEELKKEVKREIKNTVDMERLAKSYGQDMLTYRQKKQIEIDELKQECEELKKANLHIDTNRKCKEKKLKRIEDLIFSCETCYTDEFTQQICSIIQEPEPIIDGYGIITRYRKALEEIERYVKSQLDGFGNDVYGMNKAAINDILDIINKAKDKICYWDKNIDMSKATLQVDGKIICRFDNDNQMVIINDNYSDTTKDGNNDK